MKLKAGVDGRAAADVKGQGVNLAPPALPVPEPVALTVQLQASNGVCWQADYEAAGVVVNDARLLKARAE